MKKRAILGMLAISMLFLLSCKEAANTTQPNMTATAPPASSQVPAAANTTQGLQAGSPAPDFQLNDMAGKPVSLSEFRGRPVYLNFWATW